MKEKEEVNNWRAIKGGKSIKGGLGGRRKENDLIIISRNKIILSKSNSSQKWIKE